ncbi:MAG: type II toxin-antitoxin system RelB/DinJ family antitoxin [Acidobacteria bacterium]|nr:type II toxin-antitoxin system RelB/DinJ family antitoxin [Acidobacteriota bacterium]
MTRISIRMDEGLRKEADSILNELGLNMSSAVNIFMKQLVRQGGLPFTPMLETNQTVKNKQQESLNSLLSFASQNKRIEGGYKFERDDCYDR